MKMNKYLLILTLFLSSCAANREGYLITKFKETGEVDKVYNVQKYELKPPNFDVIEFKENGEVKKISGSFKVEELVD